MTVPPAPPKAAPACGSCGKALVISYYEAGGMILCGDCRKKILASWEASGGLRNLPLAFLFGTGAAIAGAALYYAVAALTGYEVGLISILVGVMVGTAVKKGAGGRTNWAYRVMAVALTYLSIVSTYAMMAAKVTDPSGPLGWVVLMIASLMTPFLLGFENIIGLLIIGFGLYEAWKLSAPAELDITGPFQVGAEVPAPPLA